MNAGSSRYAYRPKTEMVDYRPQCIRLSISLPQQVRSLRDTIRLCRLELGDPCPMILVGGLAINANPQLWQRVDADTWYPDARTVWRAVS